MKLFDKLQSKLQGHGPLFGHASHSHLTCACSKTTHMCMGTNNLACACAGEEEDKTRANAAGALGNLVRNSSALCAELIKVSQDGKSQHLKGA